MGVDQIKLLNTPSSNSGGLRSPCTNAKIIGAAAISAQYLLTEFSFPYFVLYRALLVMADPFEVRMRFTSQLLHLNASANSAQKAAHYALKYRDMHEDLHSCILEQLERVCA